MGNVGTFERTYDSEEEDCRQDCHNEEVDEAEMDAARDPEDLADDKRAYARAAYASLL